MAVFGRVWTPGPDLYSSALPDWDGVIRRVLPAQGPAEHLVYAALKDSLPPERDFSPAADARGALLVVPPEGDFRRLPLAALLEYEDADKELYRLLSNAGTRGVYAGLNPESYPGYLRDHARRLRDELVRDPTEDRKTRWLSAQEGYFQSLDNFFNGPSEARLVEGYERLIASESLDVEGLRRVTALRNELILTFRNLREKYAELLALRALLAEELANSFCILGPPGPELENSAVLANTLLAGAWIVPGSDRDVLLLAGAGVFVILAALCPLGPWLALGLGLLLTAILGAAFSCGFVLTGSWMDPLIPASAALAGVLFSFVFALLAKRRAAARFRAAYGPRMAGAFLLRLIRQGRPFPWETVTVNAAIVAIRDGDLSGMENRGGPEESAAAAAAFRKEALRLFGEAGAVMTGVEGDMAVFAFGSPLERQALKKMKEGRPYDDSDTALLSPGSRAATLVLEILKNAPRAGSWRFAVDAGQCSFSWTAASGYTASGRAVITARLLSNLCARHKTRLMASGRVVRSLGDLPMKKLGALVDQAGGEREEFYGLEDRE
jgi:class 3 adenylate cyclase